MLHARDLQLTNANDSQLSCVRQASHMCIAWWPTCTFASAARPVSIEIEFRYSLEVLQANAK